MVRRVWSQSESLLRFPHVFISLHIFPHCIPLLYTVFSCVLFKLSVFPNAGWARKVNTVFKAFLDSFPGAPLTEQMGKI